MKRSTIDHIRNQAIALRRATEAASDEIERAHAAARLAVDRLTDPNPDFGTLRTISVLEACERASRAAVRLDALIMAAYLDSIDET